MGLEVGQGLLDFFDRVAGFDLPLLSKCAQQAQAKHLRRAVGRLARHLQDDGTQAAAPRRSCARPYRPSQKMLSATRLGKSEPMRRSSIASPGRAKST